MQYMGGKRQVAKHIVSAILSDTSARDVWYEPFVGGGNVMEIACQSFRRSVGSDIHPDLILLWQHVTAGGDLPEHFTREEYSALRLTSDPSWLRGAAGFGASFGGKFFGGYGSCKVDRKHPYGHVWPGTRLVIKRQAAIFSLHDVRFRCWEFGRVTPPVGAVVYCDPPYANTTKYATSEFDYDVFYKTLQEWAKGRFVYLSEYAVPDYVNAEIIWSREKSMPLDKASNSRVAIENLYRIGPR